jgi:hypothetical protein
MDPELHDPMQDLSLNPKNEPSPEILEVSVDHVVSATAKAVTVMATILTSAIGSIPTTKQADAGSTPTTEQADMQPSKKVKLELNLPKGIDIRDKLVPDLKGRIKEVSVRAVAEGGYSNVWKGTLDDGQLVGGHILTISLLIMSGRLRLSVSETNKCKKP